ncbi:hypothetical protein F5888DRAFT_1665933 [Russula emetica]|nr:hypothetical protein F5888DRAFT_1665933 [Russula emetica]
MFGYRSRGHLESGRARIYDNLLSPTILAFETTGPKSITQFSSMPLHLLHRKRILHMFSLLILRIAERFFPRKGLIERQGRRRVTFDMLPDDVLFEIFDLYGIDCKSCCYPWRWHTLVHVCRRWRQIIFASPFRLELQFVCTPRTRVRELLEFLPPSIPIMIRNYFGTPPPCSTPSIEDVSQVIAALEQRDDVYLIDLEDLPNSLLEKLATTMQETYPTLEYVLLWAGDDTAPVLRKEFLGGSAPCLDRFWLRGIPFPDVPRLLSSTRDLVHLLLEKIPDSGYISPEAMITALSTCTKLETITIDFLGNPYPDLTSQEIASLTLISLPALNNFVFEGHGKYFHNFISRIENPLLMLEGNFNMNKRVHCEALLTPSGISFHYRDVHLIDPVPVEE